MIPKTLKDYIDVRPVSKVVDGAVKVEVEVGRFLEKVKGIQALNVCLPWT